MCSSSNFTTSEGEHRPTLGTRGRPSPRALAKAGVAAALLGPSGPTATRNARTKGTSGAAVLDTAVQNLLEAIREATEIISRLPQDGYGRIRVYGVECEASQGSPTEAEVFVKLTGREVRALTRAIGKYPAAAWRRSASIAAARDLWATATAEYNRSELGGFSTKAGGPL
jgi:hypothetical protein